MSPFLESDNRLPQFFNPNNNCRGPLFVDGDNIVIYDNSTEEFLFYHVSEDSYNKLNGVPVNLSHNIVWVSIAYNDIALVKMKEDFLECCICFEKIEEMHVLDPCGHSNVCDKCYAKNLTHCPTCRKKINKRIKVHI